MKKFIIKISLFSLPLLVSAILIDLVISKQLTKSKTIAENEYAVWNDIFKGEIDSDILINGSSRAWVHFNAQMITERTGVSCYNIGIDGHHFTMQNIRENIVLKYNKRPKIILFSLDSKTLSKRDDLYNKDQFLPYMLNHKNDLKEPLLKFDGFTPLDFEIPVIRYYGNFSLMVKLLYEFKFNNEVEGRVRGFKSSDIPWNSDFDKAKKEYSSIGIDVDSATVKEFHRYLQRNKDNGVKVVLVYSPEYIEGQNFIRNRVDIIQMYKKISKRYDLPFLDFSNHDISYDKSYFYNSTHLNSNGADRFTKVLTDSLIQLKILN